MYSKPAALQEEPAQFWQGMLFCSAVLVNQFSLQETLSLSITTQQSENL
jgi:hypothetical protein